MLVFYFPEKLSIFFFFKKFYFIISALFGHKFKTVMWDGPQDSSTSPPSLWRERNWDPERVTEFFKWHRTSYWQRQNMGLIFQLIAHFVLYSFMYMAFTTHTRYSNEQKSHHHMCPKQLSAVLGCSICTRISRSWICSHVCKQEMNVWRCIN